MDFLCASPYFPVMTSNKPHLADVSGPTLELTTQMLRVLVGAAWLNKDLVETDTARRKVISEFGYALETTDVSGAPFDATGLPPEKLFAADAALFERAEQLALAMFMDIFHGGGCGEENCCGPSGIWHDMKSYRGNAPASMTYGEWRLRNQLIDQ